MSNVFNNKHFCILPWTHMYMNTEGKLYSCCFSDRSMPLATLSNSVNMTDAWNSDNMKQIRLRMLNNEPVEQCKNCYKLESFGGHSPRLEFNEKYLDQYSVVKTTKDDGTVDKLNITYMDFRFSNVCNLKCRMCGPGASSKWFKDAAQLGRNKHPIALLRPAVDESLLWDQIEEVLPTVKRIYFAGGEPLLMEEHYKILQWLLDHNRTDVQLLYNTNFTVTTFKNKSIFSWWNQFKNVSVGASLDASFEKAAYSRHGSNWQEICDSRKQMIEECPNAEFFIAVTMNVYNFLDLCKFHKECVDTGIIKPDEWHIHYLHQPEQYSVMITPESIRNSAKVEYMNYIEFMKAEYNINETSVNRWQTAIKFLDGPQDIGSLHKFQSETKQLDAMRNESFETVFPELAFLMES